MNVSTVTIRVFSWLDGLTYRRQQRGSRVQAPIFCCGNVFISYLHSRKCPWYEMAFFIYKTKGLCIGVCVFNAACNGLCMCEGNAQDIYYICYRWQCFMFLVNLHLFLTMRRVIGNERWHQYLYIKGRCSHCDVTDWVSPVLILWLYGHHCFVFWCKKWPLLQKEWAWCFELMLKRKCSNFTWARQMVKHSFYQVIASKKTQISWFNVTSDIKTKIISLSKL